jgi:predicted O-methyltransferase YrrM
MPFRLRRERAAEARDAETHFRRDVIERGAFEHDWFTVHIPAWDQLLREFDGPDVKILELGSYEGLSTCFFLWRLPDARVTCVESFEGYFGEVGLERRFDENVALIDAGRVRKLAGRTRDRLPELLDEGALFELVYVDASHRALDVLADAALSWQLLKPGGSMLFDDYGLDQGDPLLTPTVAVDAFAQVVRGTSEWLRAGYQVRLRKLS